MLRYGNHQDLFALIYSKLLCNTMEVNGPQRLFRRALFDVCRCHPGKEAFHVSIVCMPGLSPTAYTCVSGDTI